MLSEESDKTVQRMRHLLCTRLIQVNSPALYCPVSPAKSDSLAGPIVRPGHHQGWSKIKQKGCIF